MFQRIQVFTSLLLLSIIPAWAYTVSGTVTDSIGAPVDYATVRIYNSADNANPAAVTFTSEAGQFSLSVPAKGQYNLIVSMVGMATTTVPVTVSGATTDVGNITLGSGATELSEVTVTAQRPIISKEIDRIGYDVQADGDAATATVQEVLRKVPLVTVEADGTIKVRGSTNFRIYKNGRPNNMYTRNAKDLFAAIPASSIKRIEVITDPGAREDAEGVAAILNIVTVDNTIMKGITGTASLSSSTTTPVPAPSLWLSTQLDKVTLSANGGYHPISSRQLNQKDYQRTTYSDTGNTLTGETDTRGRGYVCYWGVEGSWEPDTLNLVTLEFGGYKYDLNGWGTSLVDFTTPAGEMLYSFTQHNTLPRIAFLDFNGAVNYQRSTRRKGETITASYQVSTTNQQNKHEEIYADAINLPVPYSGIRSDFHLHFIEHTLQADWIHPFATHHTLNVGAKYIMRRNHSTTMQELIDLGTTDTDFSHITDIGAVYADWRMSRNALGLRAGVRYEFSHLKAHYLNGEGDDFSRNLGDVVPNLSASYTFKGVQTLKASLSTRIMRPGISYLNPAKSVGITATSFGNPDLESSRHYIPSLEYSLFSMRYQLMVSASIDICNNALTQYQYTEGDHLYSTYANNGRERTFSAGAYLNWMLGSKTTLMLNAQAQWHYYRIPSPSLSMHRWTCNAYMQLTQRLPWRLKAELGIYYMSGFVENAYSYSDAGMPFNRISLSRSFLKDDRLDVRISINNPIGNGRDSTRTYNVGGGINEYSRHVVMNLRSVELRLSYRFGSLNTQVKKTTSTIANDDLVGRKSGNAGQNN